MRNLLIVTVAFALSGCAFPDVASDAPDNYFGEPSYSMTRNGTFCNRAAQELNSRSAATANDDQAGPTQVKLDGHGNTLTVPVKINGRLTLDFVVDSGASDVSIPADVVLTPVRTGTLHKSDFIGRNNYQLADGSVIPSYTFLIRSLLVEFNELRNVRGSVAPVQGTLLLGQSFLGRFQSWSIDNRLHMLKLN